MPDTRYSNSIKNTLRVYRYAVERLQKKLLEIESAPESSFRSSQARKIRAEIRKNERAMLNVQLRSVRNDLKLRQRFRQEEEYKFKIEAIQEAIRNYLYLYVNGVQSTDELKRIDPILISDIYNQAEAIRKLERLILRLGRNDKLADAYIEPVRRRLNEILDRDSISNTEVLPDVLKVIKTTETLVTAEDPNINPWAYLERLAQEAMDKKALKDTKVKL